MATKPTKRILDWASGGTVTDPGAGKEAAGWVTSDRPPAQWWNWILNSFGKWLTWSEDSIDALEVEVDLLQPARVHATGVIRTGASPSILYNRAGVSSIATLSTNVVVTLSVTFPLEEQMIVLASTEAWRYCVAVNASDTDEVSFSAGDIVSGAQEDLSSTVIDIHFAVLGSLV